MLFKNIVGYNALKERLLGIGKLPATFLFTGPTGSATLTLSLAYATYLHCPTPSSADACGVCPSCLKMQRLLHPDLHFVFPIGATSHTKAKEVSISSFMPQWRDFLEEDPYRGLQDWSKALQDEAKTLQIGKGQVQQLKQVSSLKPFESMYTIVFIWLPELLHPVAANALLKTLEEPSPTAVFILVAADTTHLLPTVYSRAMEIYVHAFSDEDMLTALQQMYPKLLPQQHTLLVRLAQGDLSKAKKLAEEYVEDHFEKFAQWLRAVYNQHWSKLVAFAEELYSHPLQVQKNWVVYGSHIIRGALLAYFDQGTIARLTQQELDFCKKLSQAFKCEHLQAMIPLLDQAHYTLHRYANGKLVFLHLAMRFVTLLKT